MARKHHNPEKELCAAIATHLQQACWTATSGIDSLLWYLKNLPEGAVGTDDPYPDRRQVIIGQLLAAHETVEVAFERIQRRIARISDPDLREASSKVFAYADEVYRVEVENLEAETTKR